MQRPKIGKQYTFVLVEDGTLVDLAYFIADSDGRGGLRRPFHEIGVHVLDDSPWSEHWAWLQREGYVEERDAKERGLLPLEWKPPPSEREATDQASRFASRELAGWRQGSIERFESRKTSSGWNYAYGREIKPLGKRAKGIERRTGWAVTFQAVVSPMMEVFPDVVCVHVFDDGSVELGQSLQR